MQYEGKVIAITFTHVLHDKRHMQPQLSTLGGSADRPDRAFTIDPSAAAVYKSGSADQVFGWLAGSAVA